MKMNNQKANQRLKYKIRAIIAYMPYNFLKKNLKKLWKQKQVNDLFNK